MLFPARSRDQVQRCAPRLVLGALALLPVSLTAQCELGRLDPADGAAGDAFGSFVRVSGDRAAVCAPNRDEGGQDTGAVYVYDFDGTSWVQSAKLTASDGSGFDRFGSSVALDGDRIVVGSPQDDDGGFDSGAAYVFEYDGSSWSEVAKLTGFDAFLGDFYGVNVGLSGDRIVVGACQVVQFETFGTGDGKVYVYTGSGATWTLEQVLTASDNAAGDRFGAGIDYDGSRILVGAETDDGGGVDSGAAYVFEQVGGTWTEIQKLLPSDVGPNADAGVSVSIDGDIAVIGAPNHATGGSEPGAAYLFEFDGTNWSETAKLASSSAQDEDMAGFTVAVSGDLALVGAFSSDPSQAGRVYSFQKSSGGAWVEGTTLTLDDGLAGDRFGYGVAIEGSRILVGARSDDGIGSATEFLWSPATAIERTAGSNPSSLTVDAPPVIGTTPTVSLDLGGTTGHALGGLVGYAGPLTFPLSGGQVILVDLTNPAGELLAQPVLPGPTANWSLALPDDPALCGLAISAQGIHVGGVQPFALSNALDFVLGT